MSQVQTMIERSRVAQKSWEALGFEGRIPYFRQLAINLEKDIERYIEVICRDNGKPRLEALSSDLVPVLHITDYYCKKASKILAPKEIPLGLFKHKRSILVYRPLGVVGIISPWNFPFSIPMGEVITALIAGNSIILKPSEITPEIGKLIESTFTHFPKDVFQCLHGAVEEGKQLVASSVDKIVFTGSVRTGKVVAQECAKNLKPVSLELGGKDVMIVTDKANIDLAVMGATWGSMTNSGQVCASVERILVHQSVEEEFTNKLVASLKKLRQNPEKPNQLDVDMGRITNRAQKEIYQAQISELDPAQILTGGDFDETGLCLRPTLVKVKGSEKIWTEETFGPTIAILSYRDDNEAIAWANKSEYGLLASVWSRDQKHAIALAQRIQAGTVLINDCVYTHALAETPWFGVKNSGLGSPVHGEDGLFSMVNMQHLHFDRFGTPLIVPPWWFPYNEAKFQFLRAFARYLASKGVWGRLWAISKLASRLPGVVKKIPNRS